MRRRDLIAGALSVGVLGVLPRRLTSLDSDISAVDVQDGWAALRRLYEMDDTQGGALVYDLASKMARRLDLALQHGTYSRHVESELQLLTATIMEHSGWLAFDGGEHSDARRWWLEASHLADISGIPDAKVAALLSMSLQASASLNRGKETVQLVAMARRVQAVDNSPALQSLFFAREAVGHALLGDRSTSQVAFEKSRNLLQQGRSGSEPLWIDFWTSADLDCHETRAAVALGDQPWAISAARSAYANSDAKKFPRNHAIYSLRLGSTLASFGDIEEAASVATEAARGIESVRGSRRISRELDQVVNSIARTESRAARRMVAELRGLL